MLNLKLNLNLNLFKSKEMSLKNKEYFYQELLGYELFPSQIKWLKEIFESPEDIVLFLGARGYGKTDIITVLGLTIQIYYDRSITALVVTREFTRAKDIVYTIGVLLESLGVKGSFSKTQIRTKENMGNKQPTLRAMSTGSATKGHHVNYLIMDDPVEPKDEYSKAHKKRARKFFDESKSLRINGQSFKQVIIGQYVADDDLYSFLETKESVKVVRAWHGTIPELDTSREEYLKSSSLREWGKNYEGCFYNNDEALFSNLEFSKEYLEPLGSRESFFASLDIAFCGGDYTALTLDCVRDKRKKENYKNPSIHKSIQIWDSI